MRLGARSKKRLRGGSAGSPSQDRQGSSTRRDRRPALRAVNKYALGRCPGNARFPHGSVPKRDTWYRVDRHIDTGRGTIAVRQGYHRLDAGSSQTLAPKSQPGRRLAPLTSSNLEMFQEHRIHSERNANLLRRKIKPDDFVFAGFDREPLRPDSFSASFRGAAKRDRLPGVPFHVAGHTHAALLFLSAVGPPQGRLRAARTCLCCLDSGYLLALHAKFAGGRRRNLGSDPESPWHHTRRRYRARVVDPPGFLKSDSARTRHDPVDMSTGSLTKASDVATGTEFGTGL